MCAGQAEQLSASIFKKIHKYCAVLLLSVCLEGRGIR